VSDHSYTAGARHCDWLVRVSIKATGVARRRGGRQSINRRLTCDVFIADARCPPLSVVLGASIVLLLNRGHNVAIDGR